MQSRIDRRRRGDGFSVLRAGVLAAVIAGHLAVVVAMLRAAATPVQSSIADSLRVSLELRTTRVTRLPARPRAKPKHRGTVPARMAPPLSMSPTSLVMSHARPLVTFEPSVGNPIATPDYVPGGGVMDPMHDAQKIRLPGEVSAASAARWRMVDPRTQGVAGLVRAMRDKAGGIDPHCLDVDVWRGLTPVELAARHVSTATMDATADAYGCRVLSPPTPRGVGGPFGAAPIPRGESR